MKDMEYMQYSWTTERSLTQYHIYKRLISKLKGYGVRGQLLQWIENFLTNRKMRVILNGCAAEWIEVLSGVPQGSVVGPLLFLIYVNELPIVNSSIKMFADDTKIWKKFRIIKKILKPSREIY